MITEVLHLELPEGQYPNLPGIRMPNGDLAFVAAIFDSPFPGSNFIEITDEKLLEKLRTLKGQSIDFPGIGAHPVFYYEYLMSMAAFKVFLETEKTPWSDK